MKNAMYVVRTDEYSDTINGELRSLGGTLAVCTSPEAAQAARRLVTAECFIEEWQAPWDFGKVHNAMGRYPYEPPTINVDEWFTKNGAPSTSKCRFCDSSRHGAHECPTMLPEVRQ